MNKTIEHIGKSIDNDFTLAELLSELIHANVSAVAQEVVVNYPKEQRNLDSAKVGCYECWVNRLCGLLKEVDRDYLLQLMQQRVDKPSSRD
jgi:hypothetical protein